MKIPGLIKIKIVKLMLYTAVMAAVGTAIGVIGPDRLILYPFNSSLRRGGDIYTYGLYASRRDRNCEMFEGLVRFAQGLPLQDKRRLLLQPNSGKENCILLTGKGLLKQQCRYRPYLA